MRGVSKDGPRQDINSHSRRMFRARFGLLVPPSPIRGRRECRAPDAPAAARAEIVVVSTRVSQVTPEIARHSPRNGFNGFLRAPRRIGLVCLRRLRIKANRTRSGRPASEDLTPTIEASGPHDFTVRNSTVRLCAVFAHEPKPALLTRPRANAAASTASRPNVRDDGQRPSKWDGMGEM